MREIRTDSVEGTVSAGCSLGNILQKGDTVCLTGGLGTGKTAFVGGIAKALDISGYITSPTFTIVNEYEGSLNLYHFDVYRANDPEEILAIGFEEYFYRNGVVVIEWSELIEEILPAERIAVRIDKLPDEGPDVRRISIEFIGERYKIRAEGIE